MMDFYFIMAVENDLSASHPIPWHSKLFYLFFLDICMLSLLLHFTVPSFYSCLSIAACWNVWMGWLFLLLYWLWQNLEYDQIPILSYLFWYLQVTDGTCAAGKAHQIWSTCLHLLSFWKFHFCPFWHFSPYWLSMKVHCPIAWCHIFVGDTIQFCPFIFQCGVVQYLFIVLARDGSPLRTGVVGLLAFLLLCLVSSNVYCVHVCSSCTGGMYHSSCGVNVECCCDCYRIRRKNIIACWIMNYVGLTSDSLTILASLILIRCLLYTVERKIIIIIYFSLPYFRTCIVYLQNKL